jgi:hypothetical protein
MMTVMRNRFGKSLNQVILWLMLISMFGLGSIAGLFKRFYGSSSTIAEVNGYEISAREYRSKYMEEQRRLDYFRQQFGPMADQLLQAQGISTSPEELALNSLVQEKLLDGISDKIGVNISTEYVEKKLQDPLFVLQTLGELVPPYLMDKNGAIDRKALIKHLQRQNIALTDFDSLLENLLRRIFVMTLISGSLYIPNALIKEALIRKDGVRTYSILTIPSESYSKEIGKGEVKEEVLRDFYTRYNTAMQRYYEPEARTAEVVSFAVKNNQEQDFLMAAQQVAANPWDTSAESAFMKKFTSESKKTVTKRQSDESELAKKMFSVNPGEKSAFVEKGKGYLVAVSKVEPAKQLPYEKVAAGVLKDYVEEQTMTKMRTITEEAGNMAKKEGLQAVAKAFNGTISTIKIAGDNADQWLKLKQQNINIDPLKNMTVPNTLTIGLTDKAGYVAQLTNVQAVSPEAIAAARGVFERALYAQEMSPFIAGFVASLQKTAKIKLNQSMFYQN